MQSIQLAADSVVISQLEIYVYGKNEIKHLSVADVAQHWNSIDLLEVENESGKYEYFHDFRL